MPIALSTIHYNAYSPPDHQRRAVSLLPIVPVETLAIPVTDVIQGTGSSKPETGGISTKHKPSYPEPPMHCRLRLAKPTDHHAACRLYAEADALHARERPDRFRPTDKPARSQRLFDAHLADPDQALFVAEVDGAVVGLVRVQALERLEVPDVPALTPRRYAMVQELVVAQNHQRRGIATRLMAEAHRWARDRGLTQIGLSVYDFNQPALRLYQKLGYAPDSHRFSRNLD
ncbi:MAG: GNAT family N-acetyltransferase [Chloroflexota bacterium]|nr:GNAT family N-acetyltransferase [Chloroflexota bacterium]MDE2921116.1 GNAT family N-acetyltransferase [Chloroflexota bacterium]